LTFEFEMQLKSTEIIENTTMYYMKLIEQWLLSHLLLFLSFITLIKAIKNGYCNNLEFQEKTVALQKWYVLSV
jgi:hypothetical protein